MLPPRRAPVMDAGSPVLAFDHVAQTAEQRTTPKYKAGLAPASDRTWCHRSGPLPCRPRRFALAGWRTRRDARMLYAGWRHMLREHRTVARCHQTRRGSAQGVASGADEFGRGNGTTQFRPLRARPTTAGSRSFHFKQARTYRAFTALRNTLLDLANLGCCQRAVVGLVLRQQLDCQFMQRMMNGLRFIDA